MAQYRIVCTVQEPSYLPTKHAHIVNVGTGTDPNRAERKWTLAEVLAAMRTNTFYTVSSSTGKVALVRRGSCACGRETITTVGDRVLDNNLDALRTCNW
jgi:hypothetical protein